MFVEENPNKKNHHSFGETAENIINDLLFTTDKVHNFEKEELIHLFTFAASESFLNFEQEYYIQTDGIFKGSSSGPTLANAFFVSVKGKIAFRMSCRTFTEYLQKIH